MPTPKSRYARPVKYDREVLDLLISRANVLGLDEKPERQPRSTLQCLLDMKKNKYPYVERYNHSTGAVEDYGRFYPMFAGAAYIHRPARGALLQRFYHDLDMVNSIPNIAVQFAKRVYGHDLKHVREYVENRDAIHAHIITALGYKDLPEHKGITVTARDQAKTLVNAVMNGQSVKEIKSSWVVGLHREMVAFSSTVAADPVHKTLADAKKAAGKSLQSVLCLILQREEARVLIAIDAALTANGRTPSSWIYDGLSVEKLTEDEPTIPDATIAAVEAAVLATTGYKIALKVKPYAPYSWIGDALEKWRTLSPIERVIGEMTITGAESPIREVKVSHRFVADAVADPIVKTALDEMAGGNDDAFADVKTTFVIKSHLGTGKTTQALEWIKAHKDCRVLLISARRTFTRFIMGDLAPLAADGITFHAYDERREIGAKLSTFPHVVVQVESLWRLEEDFKAYDLVVVDESETILNQFHSFETHKDKLLRNFNVFERCVREAHRVLFADAFVTTRTLVACANLRDAATSLYINNTFNPYERKATRLWMEAKTTAARMATPDEFGKRIAADLTAGKRVAVVWTSLTAAKRFVKTHLPKDLPASQWRLYSSESRKAETAELGDVATNWKNLRLLMYTTAITIGVNYNPAEETDCFDRVYLYACSRTALPRDIAQALLRCRRIRTNELVYTVDIASPPRVAYCIDTIRADFMKRRVTLEAANPIVQWKESPKWVEDNFCLNERESALRAYVYAETLEDYLIQSGYTVEEEQVDRPVDAAEAEADEKVEADDVPILSWAEAEHIRTAMIDREASPIDRLALRRYNVYKQLKQETKEGDDPNATRAAEVWRTLYGDADAEAKFWNFVNEKHNTPEEYAAREAGRKYVEMAALRLSRRIVLGKLLPILGLTNTCAGKETFEMTAEMAKAIEPMEEEATKHFTAFGASRRRKEFTSTHATELLQAVFEAWGIKIAVEAKRKQVAGKRGNVYFITLEKEPMWDLITEKDYADMITLVE